MIALGLNLCFHSFIHSTSSSGSDYLDVAICYNWIACVQLMVLVQVCLVSYHVSSLSWIPALSLIETKSKSTVHIAVIRHVPDRQADFILPVK